MYFFTKAALILLYYSALYHYYHHDHHHHDHDHDLDQAEAEPPPTFRWLDAENQPVTDGQVVNDQYKVIDHDDGFDHDYDDDGPHASSLKCV